MKHRERFPRAPMLRQRCVARGYVALREACSRSPQQIWDSEPVLIGNPMYFTLPHVTKCTEFALPVNAALKSAESNKCSRFCRGSSC